MTYGENTIGHSILNIDVEVNIFPSKNAISCRFTVNILFSSFSINNESRYFTGFIISHFP